MVFNMSTQHILLIELLVSVKYERYCIDEEATA